MNPSLWTPGVGCHCLGFVRTLLADHGVTLLAGATAFLGAGIVAVRLQRGPIHRQRLAALTVACTLVGLVLACVPMPRLAWNWPGHPQGISSAGAPREPLPAQPLFLPAADREAASDGDEELASLVAALSRSQPVDAPAASTHTTPPPSRWQRWRVTAATGYLVGLAGCAGCLPGRHVVLRRRARRDGALVPGARPGGSPRRGRVVSLRVRHQFLPEDAHADAPT